MDYTVEVHRIEARLVDKDGQVEDAAFFVPAVSEESFDAASLMRRLNDPERRFFPCEIDDHVELVKVDHIAYVEFSKRLPSLARLQEVGAIEATVSLRLVNGETVSGTLVYEAPEIRRRVSDLLNKDQPRFLVMTSPGTLRLVNRSAVYRVRV